MTIKLPPEWGYELEDASPDTTVRGTGSFGFKIEMGLETRKLQRAAKEALASYLQTIPWDYFYTATFARPSHFANGTLDMVRRHLPHCERSLIVAEQHLSGTWHAHGLVSDYRDKRSNPLRLWESRLVYSDVEASRSLSKLGWCRVSPVVSALNVSMYCSKYLLKDERMEWELK